MDELKRLTEENELLKEGFNAAERLLLDYLEENKQLKKKVEKYEKALNKITKTSGNSMLHNFTKEGHVDSVYIAETALDFDE